MKPANSFYELKGISLILFTITSLIAILTNSSVFKQYFEKVDPYGIVVLLSIFGLYYGLLNYMSEKVKGIIEEFKGIFDFKPDFINFFYEVEDAGYGGEDTTFDRFNDKVQYWINEALELKTKDKVFTDKMKFAKNAKILGIPYFSRLILSAAEKHGLVNFTDTGSVKFSSN